MDAVNKLLKSLKLSGKGGDETMVNVSYVVFVASIFYAIYCGRSSAILLAIGVTLILYTLTGYNCAAALMGGSLVGLIAVHYSRKTMEGFETEVPMPEDEDAEDEEEEEADTAAAEADDEGETNDEEDVTEAFQNKAKKPKKKKRAPPPDNGDRAEMFELGKKYKIPKEEDDSEYHLDAGTTFLNAYKSLKPDQVAAMTKDTQELMQTQKQLMSTLHTLKPLIKDGKEMMEMFQGYFGAGMPSLN